MSSGRSFDVAVIGGGPVGFAAALALSQTARTVLVTQRLPSDEQPRRIDAIPARALALLCDLGVWPRAIGVECLHHQRTLSWEDGAPSSHVTSPVAHVERPGLERALFEALLRRGNVDIVLGDGMARWDGAFVGEGWCAGRLVDASGRSSVTAERVVRPDQPWGSRFFLTERRRRCASQRSRTGMRTAWARRRL